MFLNIYDVQVQVHEKNNVHKGIVFQHIGGEGVSIELIYQYLIPSGLINLLRKEKSRALWQATLPDGHDVHV